MGPGTGALVPNQSRTLDNGIGLALGDVQEVVDSSLKRGLSLGSALFTADGEVVVSALPARAFLTPS